ncbi:hypothetical protein OFC46_26540, partial [Escherichia coli]|nr:hypothetical protein [Escherichia coli]
DFKEEVKEFIIDISEVKYNNKPSTYFTGHLAPNKLSSPSILLFYILLYIIINKLTVIFNTIPIRSTNSNKFIQPLLLNLLSDTKFIIIFKY